MERSTFGADVSPTDNTVPMETERTLDAPRFDDKSVQRARPAVPLATVMPSFAVSSPACHRMPPATAAIS